jgi:outer membrane autotransporter protein
MTLGNRFTSIDWERMAVATAILVLGLTACASGAWAQKPPPNPPNPSTFSDVQLIVNPRLAIERAYRIRSAVNQMVGRRLAPAVLNAGPGAGTPAAMLFSGTGEKGAANDEALWNVWVDGTHTDIKDSHPVSGYEGPQNSVIAAADYQVSDRVIAGLLYNYNDSDVRNLFQPGSSTTESNGVGPYVGVVLTDKLVFDASLLANWTDNFGKDATDIARYDSDGWIASANLTGYWYFDNLRFSPGAGISLTRTEDDAYTDTSGTAFSALTTRTGTANVAATLGYTITLDDARLIEPFVTLEGEWEFKNSSSPSTVTATVPVVSREWNLRASAGVDVTLPRDRYLTIRGDFGGLNQSRFRTYAINGTFGFRF